MATLVFTALGTAIGGPLGGAIGSLVGNSVDRSIAGGPGREGPRVKDLGVSFSSYGAPLPRQHGTVRSPGVIIWSTDLVEHGTTSGGGKGSARTTTYSYTVSLAVALSSRPVAGIGRIWADGNLLRGAAGDLKTGGSLRLYPGRGDEDPDPLIASAENPAPAFRGTAYCVFEDLDLTDFGNRIPALTFEIFADAGGVDLAALLEPLAEPMSLARALDGLLGYSNEGGTLGESLAVLDQLYPLACDAGGERLALAPRDALPAAAPLLPPPAAAPGDGESFAPQSGVLRRRRPDPQGVPDALRYYDPARDYQPGLQRADGRARPGRKRAVEFPGVLSAGRARALVNGAAARAASACDTLAWRTAELDPGLGPGRVVRVPGRSGLWSVDSWEWREMGIELQLRRIPGGSIAHPTADAGRSLTAADLAATPTVLCAFELPWDGTGDGEARRVFAACSSESAGWQGAAIYLVQGSDLVPLASSGRRRSIVGTTASALPASPAALLERSACLEVDLLSADFALDQAGADAIAGGANRALVGQEILQFACAERLTDKRWRLAGLLRGRGGTEAAAQAGCPPGSTFVLLDERPRLLDAATLPADGAATLAAIGLADDEPFLSALVNPGLTRRPPSPVHPAVRLAADGSAILSWCRRARGAWTWPDAIDAPLAEQSEAYLVAVGDVASPALAWTVDAPHLTLDSVTWSGLVAEHPGSPLWVRQVGTAALSDPLLLAILP